MDVRVQVPQFGKSSDVYTSLGADFMPYWLETHSDYRIKALELGVPDIDIFQIEVLLISHVTYQEEVLTRE
jgi:hypothetical protein